MKANEIKKINGATRVYKNGKLVAVITGNQDKNESDNSISTHFLY